MSKKYRMSSAQKRMFAITEMHENDIVYNVPMLWKIEGQIDVERLQRSFSQLCARHEPLRTYFVHQKDKFLQVVKEEGDIYLDYEEASEDQIQQLFKEHVRPFNLGEAPLMRAKIVRISSNEHVLMLDIHHIIFDDGSKHVLLSDLCHFYNNEEIPPLRIQYKDYSAWLNSRDMREQERYWTEEFSGEVSTLDLKTDYPRPQQQQYGGRSIDLLLPLELKERVKQLSHHSGATEYMILLACFMVLMNRYTRQNEIVVGSPIAGRVHAETDEMLGMFVNTLAIRGEFRTGMTFQTLLSQIQERCLKAYENQEYPFDELVEKIGVERDPARNPLFDVMFVLQKNEHGSFKLGDALLTSMDVGLTVAKFDLTVSVEEVEEGYNVNWEYCDALFAADTLQHMALQFKELVGEIMAQPDLVLSELGLITSVERKRVLAEFNNTERECNLEKTAIMLFEEQVARAPEHIAVEFQGRVLTYRELNARANAVGATLLEKGVGPDQIVALIATRSLDMIIGIYGILKAGAAYLPIDPEQPLERIRYIIEDSGTSHIVFEENTKKTAAALEEQQGIQILNVAEVQEEIEENPQPLAKPEHLAYVIYTSGTTGQPKGVLVENRNLVNLVSWQRATGELHEDSVMLQKSTYIFDAAVWEKFSILLAGGKLVLATESENRDPKELLELITKTQVTHALIVPSSFRMILEYAELHQLAEQLMSLQKIYLGAEPLTPDLVSKYTQLTGSGTDRLVNLYGPTEATVCATYMQLEEDYGGNVPIGRPLWNTQIYILQDDWLCGYGIPGELCIGGAGVARGYLNRTDLTNEKFVSNPYVPGGRIYRTGDLARWKTDGTIEYLGRIGDQVKIRGYRVEPGEIETHLRNIESVQDAVVVVKTDNTRSDYLCAYVVGEGELDGERIRENLRSILPSYMVPSYVVQLEALPLTRNGKLDKKALPEPDRTSTQTYTAPRNALEEVIATVFREVLGLEQVGIDDDFYTLGGDSIKAIRILSKMREQGYDLGVRTIMQGRTIRGMSSEVTVSVASTVEQGEVTGQVNPTPIQCQFWSESLGEPHHFNQSFLLESVDAIHETALRQALDAITAHHDMLRAVYREGVQTIRPIASGAAYEMTVLDYRSITDQAEARTALHQQADQMQRSLDLANGPLVKVGMFHTNERDYVLLIVHHLLIDGVSWRILLEDLQQAYASILAGQAVTLPPKTGSYAGWSKALERYRKSAELQQELGYWQTVEAQMEESGEHWSGRGSGEGIGHLEVSLNVKQTEALLYQANRAYHTEINDLLVTALAQAMWTVTGQGTAALQMEGHGRERIGEEYVMDRTVGWFTSIYPVAVTGMGQDPGEDIQQTKEILRCVPNRGIGYGILKWLGESELSGIEPEVTLNYLGEFGQETNQGTWRLSEEERGEEVSEANRFGTPISVNGAVMDKRLQMRISYEREACDDRQMHALAEAFMDKLIELIEHCVSRSETEHTPSDFGERTWTQKELNGVMLKIQRQGYELERIYPLTSLQEGMLYHKVSEPSSTSYVVQVVYQMEGIIDIEALKESLQLLTIKHDVLRTSIVHTQVSIARQVLLNYKNVEFSYLDLRNDPESSHAWEKVKREDVERGFDLENDSLLRAVLVDFQEKDTRLVLTFHHIIMDGWSMSLLVKDLLYFYMSILHGTSKEELQQNLSMPTSYGDYIVQLEIKDQASSLSYWKELLQDYESSSDIVPEGNPDSTDKEVERVELGLSKSETIEVENLCSHLGITVNTMVEAAWGIVLQKYNDSSEAVFGKIVSGRNINLPHVEEIVGLFINMIPVHVQAKAKTTMRELLLSLQQQALQSSEHDYCSLADIQNLHEQGSYLIQTMLAFENYFVQPETAAQDESFKMIEAREQTNYSLTLLAMNAETLDFALMYDTHRYSREEVSRILGRLRSALIQIVVNPEVSMDQIRLTDKNEMDVILNQFNATDTAYPSDRSVVDLFHSQAALTPDQLAVVSGEEQMTYRELEQRSSQLAEQLRRAGVERGDYIGIMAERNTHTITGILAILKVGAAYMPIDPKYPDQRIAYMLKDSRAKIVLIGEQKPEALKTSEVTILSMLESEGAREEVAPPPETVGQAVEEGTGVDWSVHADDIAYLMYTSGTTGEPKGVMVEHRSINRLVKETNYADFTNARILQTGSLSFDASTFEIWGALLNGGTLFLIEEDTLTDPAELREVLTQNRINLMFITTALFNQLIRLDAGIFDGVTQLLFGGEATSEEHVDLLLARDHGVRLTNVYGPTENTTFSTYYPINRKTRGTKTPIGKPISNTYAYIMNESGLCGIGMPGELYVGGAGVSQGYLNQAARTATSFIANPYRPGEQMYRTGDLARWRSDGNIEYLGRMDQQVKLRGFRIELGEIESRLLEQAGIAEATVQLRKDADDYLCAYVVGEGELDGERIRENLRSILPSYMVPSYVVQLEALPLTRNGKLDRKALPKPELEGSVMYEAPCDEIEQCIADIFSEILGVSPVGVQDHFFERGGHSLRAARLVNRLETQAGLRLSVRDVFAYPTVRLLANRAKEMKGSRSFVPIPAQKVLPYYETSSPQKRLYVIDRMQPGTITYNMPEFIQLKGKLNVEKLQQALQALVDRHEPLRTSFEIQNGEPVQIVKHKVHFELEYEKGTYEHMASAMKTFIRPFDLTVAPLMRAKVWQIDEDDAIFMMDFHHMIYDGGSVPVLMRDLQYLFEGRTLPELRVQYKDYSCWQNERDLSEQEQYWASELSGDIPVLELFTDEPRPKEQSFDGSSIPFQLSKETKEAVRKLSHSTGATDYMILLSGFMLLLSQCSGQEDIIIGSPISGRVHADTENMLGMFVNTLAIRGELSASQTFSELVHQIKEKCLKAYENQEYPFERVVDQFAGQRDLSRNPVFDVMLTLQNNEFSTLALGDLILNPVEYPYEIAKFDLTVSMRETEQGYDLHWEYCTALFHMDTIKRMAAQFEELLKNALSDPNQMLGAISIVHPHEKHLILNQFNATDTAYPSDRSVVDLFYSQAALTPDQLAVVSGEEQMTYRELEQRSNQLAEQLRLAGVERREYVGIMAERNTNTITGILAILKVGAAYMPIDPKYPDQRIAYMLKDSRAKIVLIGEQKPEALKTSEVTILSMLESEGAREEVAPPPETVGQAVGEGTGVDWSVHADDIAYLMYTSGTTGEPKGVMVEHRSINRLVKETNYADFTNARILQTGSLSFDASTFEIWGALLNGGTLFLIEEDTLTDPAELREVLTQNRINLMFITTALFNQLIRLDAGIFDGVTQLLFGGEATSEEHVDLLLARDHGVRLTNVYGPTENTTFSTYYPINRKTRGTKTPIGKPISNTYAYIMNESGLCGIGMPGELYVGGAGVSQGYLNQAARTATSFIANPYRPEEQMYRTGDLARWRSDGNIEYLGRMDQQVKLRGFRIELGEIESRLLEQAGIAEATVQLRKDADDYLCAYVVGEGELDGERIRENLRSILPSYMVPSYVVQLEALPLTRNGKLDRKALPEPDRTSKQTYTAPRNALEEVIATVFREVLGLEQVGIDDDFYTLGGDSIKAIRILSKMREQGYDLGVRTIMQGRTIRGMSSEVTVSVASTVEQGEVTGQVNPTPIQCQFWSESLGEPHHFNQSFLLESVDAIHETALRQALDAITAHHDMLRAVYREGVQTIRPIASGAAYEMTVLDYRSITDQAEARTALHQQADQMQRSLDLANGPLVSVGLFHTNERDYVLLIVHHLLIDGVSWRILLEDLQQAYASILAGQAVTLPPKTGSYAGWSKALERYRKSAELQQELGYWQTVEAQMEESGKRWSGRGSGEGIGHLEVSLNVKQTEALLYQANRAYHTEINDLLVTALAQAMWTVTGQGTAALQMEGHGRERIGEEYVMDRTVGWFTSIYPVAITGMGQDLGEDIQQTKEILRCVPNRGIGYGILKWLGESELSGIEPEVTLNYLGEFGQETNQGTWRLSQGERGEEVSEANRFGTPISVNGAVMDKRLQMRISYEREACDDRQMHALAAAFMHKLKNIVSHCIEVSTSQQTSSHAMVKGKYGAELLDPHKFHHNTDYPVLNSYAPSVLQQLFIRTADTVVVEKIELQGSRTQKEIIQACHQIIRMQSALRSSYRMDSLVGTISEHEWDHAWHMPYIDLRYASPDERNAVSQQISKLSPIEFNEGSSQLLVKLVIVRNAERQHTIHIIAHHSVWDKTSTVIFKEMFDEGSMMNTPRETLLSYSQYIADKHKQNDLFKGSGLTLPGNMEKWIPVLHEYMDHNVSNEISQSVASVIPLGPNLLKVYKEKPWDLLLHAVQIIAKENGLIPPSSKRIPVFILQEDRAYTPGSYSHVMGEFLDMLPIVVQEAGETGFQSIQEQVEHIQKVKREQSIHYLELVHEIEKQLMYWLPSLLSVNFQATFDLSYEDFKNMMTLDHYRTTNEIFVNRFADSLVIYYPLYSKRQDNLDAVLQKEFELLEQSLSSVTTSM